MSSNLSVSESRIAADIDALAGITEEGRPYTRRAFSPLFLKGRAYIEAKMKEAGLETRIDAGGNLIGLRRGTVPGLGTLMLGSHSDTVPDGGRFDGVAGVVAGIEVARALSESGTPLRHDLEVVDFLAEEVSIFGVSCIGSRGMTGQLPDVWLKRKSDERTLHQAIIEMGGNAGVLARQSRPDIAGFLELHIEQGPVLEASNLDVGVVTAISGITRIEITIEGRADHAGTTPMNRRSDALVAAAKLVVDVREAATELASGQGHFTATVGEFRMEPNAANVVPSRVTLLIDARAEHRATMETFCKWIKAATVAVASRNTVLIPEPVIISDNPATPGNPLLLDILDRAADAVGARHRRMASGAGHDTAWIAKVAPAAMIFVPCRDGRSHASDEWADTADIALGTAVLMRAVLAMDEIFPQVEEKRDGTHTR